MTSEYCLIIYSDGSYAIFDDNYELYEAITERRDCLIFYLDEETSEYKIDVIMHELYCNKECNKIYLAQSILGISLLEAFVKFIYKKLDEDYD